MTNKFVKFLTDMIKVSSLLIAYILVDSIEVSEKGDIERKEWALDVLAFYNIMFVVIVCFIMLVRMCGPSLKQCYAIFVPTAVVIAHFFIIGFVLTGWTMCFTKQSDYDDPDQKSTSLEISFYMVYIFNALILLHMIGLTCYVVILM